MSSELADLGSALDALRKATSTAKRTHEAQLQASSAHSAALKHLEDAVTAAREAFQQEKSQLETERDQLASWRQELDEERASLIMEGGLKEEVPEEPDHEVHVQQAEESFAEPEPVPEEAEAAEDNHDGGKSYAGGGRDRGSSGKGANQVQFDERRRSRSPRRKAPPAGTATEEAVKERIETLGLDDRCAEQVMTFPPDEAMNMLDKVTDHIRNPSAFVMNMCKRTQQDSQAPRQQRPDEGLQERIDSMGLDNSCTRALQQLSPDQALFILEQVDEGVRNPSAFVMAKAHAAMKGGGKGKQEPSAAERLEMSARDVGLDNSSLRMLQELPPEQGLDILDRMGQDVRNPSAFVTAEVRKIRDHGGGGGSVGGRGGDHARGGDHGRAVDHGGRGGRNSGGHADGIERQVLDLARNLELDQDCLDSLQDRNKLSVQDAVAILDRLARAMPGVRNRSAFVYAEVRKCKQAGQQPELQPQQVTPRYRVVTPQEPNPLPPGGTRSIPCKFFAENRCKNGLDCRFKHA